MTSVDRSILINQVFPLDDIVDYILSNSEAYQIYVYVLQSILLSI